MCDVVFFEEIYLKKTRPYSLIHLQDTGSLPSCHGRGLPERARVGSANISCHQCLQVVGTLP